MNDILLTSQPADGVMLLTLNRPERRNALDIQLTQAMSKALQEFEQNPHWRVAILTGASPAFCAGLDLHCFSNANAPRHLVTELICSIPALSKPIIAAVNGAAYTGGLEIALACDFILASDSARFADTHAKIGALSGSGMGSRLPHVIGARFAKQMMLSCQPIDAKTALRIGLVNEILPSDALMLRAIEIATAIADHDSDLVRITKAVIDQGSATSLTEAIKVERNALANRKAQSDMDWPISGEQPKSD